MISSKCRQKNPKTLIPESLLLTYVYKISNEQLPELVCIKCEKDQQVKEAVKMTIRGRPPNIEQSHVPITCSILSDVSYWLWQH